MLLALNKVFHRHAVWEVFNAQCWLLQFIKLLSAHFNFLGKSCFVKG